MGRISHGKQADLDNIILERNAQGTSPEQISLSAAEFSNYRLKPGDIVYINQIRGVAVVGEIRKPGQYSFQPGLTADDYVMLAGGITRDGSPRKVEIMRVTGRSLRGGNTEIEAGDTIFVPRSFNSVFLGQLGMIQAALTFLNIYLAYLAARAS